jgi:dipicolinate synthase subunit A
MEENVAIRDVFESGNKKTLFLGGMIPKSEKNAIDYALSEEFLIKNAVLTAEGALETAMQEMKTALYGSETLIAGFGRIGSYLARILKDLGAKTTVVARSEKSKVNSEISGHRVISADELGTVLPSTDLVFNTAPSVLFKEKELKSLKKDAFIIDLASLPGGVDFYNAERIGIKTIHTLGLPGKYAPETAGRIIFEATSKILRERGISA